MPANLLISSVGAKVPLIETVREAMRSARWGEALIGADSNPDVLGRHFCDRFLQLPAIGPEGDFATLLELFKAAGVAIVFPTRDGELPFYARYRDAFAAAGIQVMVSGPESIVLLQDKLRFSQALQRWGFPGIPTATSAAELPEGADRFVAKPRSGAGAQNVSLRLSRAELAERLQTDPQLVGQPFVSGREYSVDLYLSTKGAPVGAICRERLLVVDGESQLTQSVARPELEALCLALAQKLEIRGHAIVQLILDESDQPHIIECNGRFGGASPLATAMGLTSFAWFIGEVARQEPPRFVRSAREKRLIRHKQDLVVDL